MTDEKGVSLDRGVEWQWGPVVYIFLVLEVFLRHSFPSA